MKHGILSGSGLRRVGAIALVALLSEGCVTSASGPSETALPPTPPPATQSSAAPASSPTSSTASQAAPAAPSGTWKSIAWTAEPVSPALGMSGTVEGQALTVYGWSGGYVAFALVPNQSPQDQASADTPPIPTVTAGYSADGVHWHAGQTLDPKAAGSTALMSFKSVIEGPAGLLAVGWTGACGSDFLDSLWTSSDGKSWQPENVATAFGPNAPLIHDVSGGPSGYVATALNGAGAWTSKDGRTWTRVATTSAAFANSLIDDGTAGSDDFVLAGTAGVPDCGVTVGPAATPVPRTASVWWSADASSWTRVQLPGARPMSGQSMWVGHLTPSQLLAVDSVWSSGKETAWGSKDGRSWVPVTLPAGADVTGTNGGYVVCAGRHNLVVSSTKDELTSATLRLATIDPGFDYVSVAQTGQLPEIELADANGFSYGRLAVGPTGVVVAASDGSALWFGQPSS